LRKLIVTSRNFAKEPKNELGGTRYIERFSQNNGREYFRDLEVGGRILLKIISEESNGMYLSDLTQCPVTDISEICKESGDTAFGIIIIIVIQPLGRSAQRPELSQATGMALVRCILGKFLGVVCHCFPLLLV
jgi:hypothetical protein